MSAGKSPVAVWRDAIRDSDLSSTTKLVAFVLSTYMSGDKLTAWPARSTIARGCSVSVRAVDKHILTLEERSFLDVLHSDGGNPTSRTSRTTNTYSRTLPWATETMLRGEPRSPKSSERAKESGTDAATPDGASSVLDYCVGPCGGKYPTDQLDQHNGFCQDCAARAPVTTTPTAMPRPKVAPKAAAS